MIQSFIVYTIFALFLFVCSKRVTNTQVAAIETKGHWCTMPSNYWWCLFIFAFVAGIRYDVGLDHLSYLDSYIDALNGRFQVRDRGIEEAYAFITVLFGRVGIHPILYFGFLAALQIGIVLLAFKTERTMVPWMLLFIVLGGPFFTWMNGIRQMIAACIFLFSTQFIARKEIVPFLLCLILAYFWHHSALILAPVFLLAFDPTVWQNTKFNLIVFIACFILGNIPTWVSNISNLGGVLQLIGYDTYADTIENLTDIAEFRSFNFGPRMITMLATYCLAIVLYPKASDYFNNEKLDFVFKFFFIGICSYYLFVNTTMLFLRPVLYFTIFTAPVVGYILAYLYNNKKNILFIALLITSMSYTYLSCMSDANKPLYDRSSYLYEFYFDHDVRY